MGKNPAKIMDGEWYQRKIGIPALILAVVFWSFILAVSLIKGSFLSSVPVAIILILLCIGWSKYG